MDKERARRYRIRDVTLSGGRPDGARVYEVDWPDTLRSKVEVVVPGRFVAALALKAFRNRSGRARQAVTKGERWERSAATAKRVF